MLCAVVSENQKTISTLTKQIEDMGFQYIIFYNSIVALAHLMLFRPNYFIIDSSAFSFISYQSFVNRFQLYDKTLSHLIVVSNELRNISVPIQKTNLLSAPEDLTAVLTQLLSRHTYTPDFAAQDSTEPPAFFFSNSPAELGTEPPNFSSYLFRIHVCLFNMNQTELLDLLDRLFFSLNALADYPLYCRICEELHSLYCGVHSTLFAQNSVDHMDINIFQDVFQALTHYKKLFYTLCGLISDHFEQDSPDIGRLIHYICEHDSSSLSLNKLSRLFHFNASYLSHLFKETTGISLSTFINNVRIHHACTLLEESNLSVAAVANHVGYSDPKYFARIFKNATQASPSTYRQLFSILQPGASRGR